MMKPRNAAIIGGMAGLTLGLILLSDIAAGPVFGMLVGGFIGYEAMWALRTIGTSKAVSKSVTDKAEKTDKSTGHDES